MNLGQWIVIGLSALLVIWYFGASMFNRRRGIATYQWLRRGLEQVGEKIEGQWLGSSGTGAKLTIPRADKPFRKLQTMYVLETREILPYWILTHLSGKRDKLTITATLRKTPQIKVVVGRTNQSKDTSLIQEDQKQTYEQLQAPEDFAILWQGPADPESEQRLMDFLNQTGAPIERISLGGKSPHLEIRLRIKSLEATPPVSFFSNLRSWLEGMID